ncbi:MAG: hypothetical protein ACON5H_07760 [Akkermansiaceae bacterium]
MLACLASIFLLLIVPLPAEELYFTDFENFPLGDNRWIGTDGWQGTENSNGVSFIDDNAFTGSLGQTAGLGLERPNNRRVSILKVLNHDHTTSGEHIIEIETLISIRDSNNNFRDDFYLSLFNNSGGNPIASIRFDNEDPDANNSRFGIWREDGVNQFDTQLNFIHEELYDLYIRIDLNANTWSADLSGDPLFTNETLTNSVTGSNINLGIVGYEWEISSPVTLNHGDNFLLVADLRVTSLDDSTSPVAPIISRNEAGQIALNWHGKGGFDYQVEYSSNLETWLDDLPNSLITPGLSSGPVTFTDTTSPFPDARFYRVVTKAP